MALSGFVARKKAALVNQPTAILGHSTAASSLTMRQFLRALTVVVAAVATGSLLYVIETLVLRCRHRFVENPTEVVMRALGLAHFAVGWLFLLTSPRLRALSSLLWLALLAGLGVALCLAFHHAGGGRNVVVLLGFYALFLVHEVRDEKDLYLAYEGRPRRPGLSSLATSVCLLLITGLAAASLLHALIIQRRERLRGVRPVNVSPGAMVLAAVTLVSCRHTWLTVQRHYGGWHRFHQAHAPLLQVYAGIMFVLLAGSVLGSVGFNLIILLHVAAWLAFVQHRLATNRRDEVNRGLTPPARLWRWLRHSPGGFV